MASQAYLGNPPQRIIDWIKNHSQPASHPETRFTLQGGTVETYNITGALDLQWMIANGYYDENEEAWLKFITQADIGNTVTSMGNYVFEDHESLTIMTIPDSVASIGEYAFYNCSGLTNMTMPNVTNICVQAFGSCSGLTSITIGSGIQGISAGAFDTLGSPVTLTIGKTVAEVQAMGQTGYDPSTNAPYSEWYLPLGSTIVCTNGTIPIE